MQFQQPMEMYGPDDRSTPPPQVDTYMPQEKPYGHQDRFQREPYQGGHPDRFRKDPYQAKGLSGIKNFFFVYNLIFFLCACTLLGVGIWIAADRAFMATIMGNPLYAVAAYIIIAGGALMFFITFLACCGAISENKTMLKIYFAIVVVITVIVFLAGLLAFIFRTQLGDAIKDEMRKSLKEDYGVDLEKRWNRAVTRAWDKAQERLYCCAVDTNGWDLYRETKWFELYGGNENILPGYDEKDRPYVPKSCCVRDRWWHYFSIVTCQTWRFGPPGVLGGGAINRALYYQGCYDAGVDYVIENSTILGTLAITFTVLLIAGIVFSFVLLRRL